MATKVIRVLLTGSTGFTGHYLSRELSENGFEVVEFNDSPSSDSNRESETFDLRNQSYVDARIRQFDPTYVVHLAAIAFVGHSSAKDMYDVNVMGTRNLLQALAQNGKSLEKVIIASSANVYGNSEDSFISEQSSLKPQNDYAVTKVAVENLAAIYGKDLPIVVTRPFNYTGVGQGLNFLVPKLVDHFARAADQVSLGNLEISRDFSDVRTVAWAYRRLLEAGIPGETYNIASGQAFSLASIVEKLESLTCRRISISSEESLSRKGEVLHLRGDASKLWSTIGEPPTISFDETLKWMLSAYVMEN